MHPPECGEWEYDDHPQVRALLPARCEKALDRAKEDPLYTKAELHDTRSTHRTFFDGLTPPDQGYLAGNYRGSDYPCLKYRPAVIRNAFRVIHTGADAQDVADKMVDFHRSLNDYVDELLAAPRARGKRRGLSDGEFLQAAAAILATHLEWLFTIHPYANGNGHMGRWLVWMALIRLKKFPRDWPLEERPAYDEAVQLHREGNPEPLRRLILKCIRGY